jgi:dolichol-phosphate mannosyltransferase
MRSPSFTTLLAALEDEREARWLRQGRAAALKLHWRALFTEKYLHLLPGERVLEFGSGSGALTEQLSRTCRGRNPITGVVFSPDLLKLARKRQIPNVKFISIAELAGHAGEFDAAVGLGMLWHDFLDGALEEVLRALAPGGQMLFFEPNLRFPARILNELSSRRKDAKFRRSPEEVLESCSRLGFVDADLMPHDIVSCRLGYGAMKAIQAKAILVEHMPALRLACGTMCVSARKPGTRERVLPSLTEHASLRRAVSFVVPAHNEEPNIRPLVDRIMALYGDYVHEILIVNDNSTDRTGEVAAEAGRADARVRVIDRSKPNGVGRALRDGYTAATGRYILSMDCDFIEILPELRGLFDAVASGRDGAIGSRFTHESVLINYPFSKMLLNRFCHALIKLFLLDHVRDVSNNLKLYRADILRDLEIESPHFSANLETGLKPILAGYDIAQTPISWINRTAGMGVSTFRLGKVGGDYARALYRCWRARRTRPNGVVQVAVRRLAQAVRHG